MERRSGDVKIFLDFVKPWAHYYDNSLVKKAGTLRRERTMKPSIIQKQVSFSPVLCTGGQTWEPLFRA
jgi:hypothetical protein